MTDDGARDERLAGLLEVEPLDELTRRRLVSTALRASSPPARRTSRLVAAVAAATVVVAGGIGLLVVNDDGGGVPTADRSREAQQPLDKSAEAAPTPSSAAPSTSVVGGATAQSAIAVRDVGELGNLADPAELDRARAALAPAVATTFGGADTREPSRASSLVSRARAASCARGLSSGTIVAVGTGTFDGRDAIVVATELDDGTQVIEAVVLDPCEIRPLD
jgi:hypothetical protein